MKYKEYGKTSRYGGNSAATAVVKVLFYTLHLTSQRFNVIIKQGKLGVEV